MKKQLQLLILAILGLVGWTSFATETTTPNLIWRWDGSGASAFEKLTINERSTVAYTISGKVFDHSSLNIPAKNFTYSFWVKDHGSGDEQWQNYAGFADSSAAVQFQHAGADGMLALYNQTGTTIEPAASFDAGLSTSEFKFLTIVQNSGTVKIFINGKGMKEYTISGWANLTADTATMPYFGLGCSPTTTKGANRSYATSVADVRLYDTALTAEDVLALYEEGVAEIGTRWTVSEGECLSFSLAGGVNISGLTIEIETSEAENDYAVLYNSANVNNNVSFFTFSDSTVFAGSGDLVIAGKEGDGASSKLVLNLNGSAESTFVGNLYTVNEWNKLVSTTLTGTAFKNAIFHFSTSYNGTNPPPGSRPNSDTLTLLGDAALGGLITTRTTDSVTGAGYTLTLNVAEGKEPTFAGVISTTLALVKEGTGTQVLSGANTYSGATTINDGTLKLTGDLSSFASAITLNGGSLVAASADLDVTTTVDGMEVKKVTDDEGVTTYTLGAPTPSSPILPSKDNPELSDPQAIVDAATSSTGISVAEGTKVSIENIAVNPDTGVTTITIGETVVTVPKYYAVTVKDDGTGFNLALKETEVKPVIAEDVKITDDDGNETTIEPIEVTATGFNLAIPPTINDARLKYIFKGAVTYSKDERAWNAIGEPVTGDGKSKQFKYAGTDYKFFKVVVTD